jgi:hypothetical protein
MECNICKSRRLTREAPDGRSTYRRISITCSQGVQRSICALCYRNLNRIIMIVLYTEILYSKRIKYFFPKIKNISFGIINIMASCLQVRVNIKCIVLFGEVKFTSVYLNETLHLRADGNTLLWSFTRSTGRVYLLSNFKHLATMHT